MTEFREALDRMVEDVQLRADFFSQLQRRRNRRILRTRALVAAMAVGIVGTGIGIPAYLLLHGGNKRATIASGNQTYYVNLPDQLTPSATHGTYIVDATTDLPDGTNAYVETQGPVSGDEGCCHSVAGGHLQISLENNQCLEGLTGLVGSTFKLTLIVSADYGRFFEGPAFGSSSSETWQPQSVTSVLGPSFQDLTGPQVTTEDGLSQIVVSHDYEMPADTCTAKLVPDPNSAGNFIQEPVN